MNVHWREGFAAFFCGFISLSSGASLGPEAPLGAFGGALGAWLGERFKRSKPVLEMWVLCGMAASFGAIFSSPVLAVLELATVHRTRYMEVMVLAYTSAVVAFAVYNGMGHVEWAKLACSQSSRCTAQRTQPSTRLAGRCCIF